MGIGLFLECPNGLESRIPELVESSGVRVDVLHQASRNGSLEQRKYVFRTWLACIEGRLVYTENACRIWLTFPRNHAFNPLFWAGDFRLTNRIGRLLCEGGARRCVWNELR
jgi:hypothetical protein